MLAKFIVRLIFGALGLWVASQLVHGIVVANTTALNRSAPTRQRKPPKTARRTRLWPAEASSARAIARQMENPAAQTSSRLSARSSAKGGGATMESAVHTEKAINQTTRVAMIRVRARMPWRASSKAPPLTSTVRRRIRRARRSRPPPAGRPARHVESQLTPFPIGA